MTKSEASQSSGKAATPVTGAFDVVVQKQISTSCMSLL